MAGNTHLLIAFTITELVACLTPGPAVMAVIGVALTGSLRGMAGMIAGINVSNIIWYAMVGAGLVALVHTAPVLFKMLSWAGLAYLLYLGIETWIHPIALSPTADRKQTSATKGFVGGIALQLSNPKAFVFFTVFLPPFINVHHAVTPQIVTLASIGVAMEILVLSIYGILAYRLGRLSFSPKSEIWIARTSGGILVVIALGMALSQLA